MLRPQDIVALAWLLAGKDWRWRYTDLAQALSISSSEAHAAINRLEAAGLVIRNSDDAKARQPNLAACEEFLLHGVQYAFYAKPGPIGRGMPTGVAAPPLNKLFSLGEEMPVWPDPEGESRGVSVQPLYKTVPVAARKNPGLYELLALIDALRCGRSRERNKAKELLKDKVATYAASRTKS